MDHRYDHYNNYRYDHKIIINNYIILFLDSGVEKCRQRLIRRHYISYKYSRKLLSVKG